MSTLINVQVTHCPCKMLTFTYWAISALLAPATILAGVRVTMYAIFTTLSTQLRRAFALIGVGYYNAFASVKARRGGAGGGVDLALHSRKPLRTGTLVATATFYTCSSIEAGVRATNTSSSQIFWALKLNISKSLEYCTARRRCRHGYRKFYLVNVHLVKTSCEA